LFVFSSFFFDLFLEGKISTLTDVEKKICNYYYYYHHSQSTFMKKKEKLMQTISLFYAKEKKSPRNNMDTVYIDSIYSFIHSFHIVFLYNIVIDACYILVCLTTVFI